MPDGYKVKLADGKVYGPMRTDLLKRWFEEGRLTGDSPVLPAGSARWTTLGRVVNLRSWAPGAASRAPSKPARGEDSIGPGVRVAGVLFLLGTLLSAARAFAPPSWLPDLSGVPWLAVAGTQLVLGLGLFLGSHVARMIVLALMALATLAYLGLAGLLVIKEIRGPLLLLVFCGLVSLIGYYLLLLGTVHSRGRIATGVTIVLVSGMGAFAADMAPALRARREIEKWSSADRRYDDKELGVTLDLPPGWVILKSDYPLLQTPPNTKLLLAHPNLAAFAFLTVDRRPHGIASLDHYLDRFMGNLKKSEPDLKELQRADARIGSIPARTASVTFKAEGLRFRARFTVWQDGWNYFALMAGGLDHLSRKVNPELDTLLQGFKVYGIAATRLEQAIQRITDAAPHLSRISASMLVVDVAGRELQPAEAFRMGFDLAAKGLVFLPPEEAREMQAINERLYASVPAKDRARLGLYFERVRGGGTTSPEEDEQMCSLVKAAVLGLPQETRRRLQDIYEKLLAPVVMRTNPVVAGS